MALAGVESDSRIYELDALPTELVLCVKGQKTSPNFLY